MKKRAMPVSHRNAVIKAARKTGRSGSKAKGRKQGDSQTGESLWRGFLWLILFAFCLWLLVVLFMQTGGAFGGKISYLLKDNIGYASYVFPFVFLYCLAAVLVNINKPHKGLLTMTAGLILFISSLCGIMARISMIAGDSNTGGSLVGGRLGYLIDNTAVHILGGFGAALFSLLVFFAGVQLLFRIPWISIFSYLFNLVREDYQIWSEGKQELSEKLKIASDREAGERPYNEIEPVREERQDVRKTRTDSKSKVLVEDAKPEQRYLDNSPTRIMRSDDHSVRKEEKPAVRNDIPENNNRLPVKDVSNEEKTQKEKTGMFSSLFSSEKKEQGGYVRNIPESQPKRQRPPAPAPNMPPKKLPPGIKVTDPYYKDFKLPGTDLLDPPAPGATTGPSEDETMEAKLTLENTFKSFGIEVHVTEIHPGPVVTRYEVSPGIGVKITSITGLAEDVALAMRSGGAVRVTGHIPGKAAIGFEIPNKTRAKVSLRELLESGTFINSKDPLTVALGRYAEGAVAVANLEKMPHLLIAGATASGKSVFMQSLILSLMFRNKPDEVKFLFIDPKRMELTFYEDIPYLYDPKCGADQVQVITDADEAAKSLQGMVQVMYDRTKKFSEARAKNMASYNKWALENSQPQEYRIVVVVDELADLMIQQKKVVEDAIQRLAQMARAVGIHLVLATQRPSTDVITGVIKANLPSRVALKVTSSTDSRVILDQPGANSLLGYGDLLYLATDKPVPSRIQGAFVSEEEIKRVADFVKQQARPNYEPLRVDEPTESSGKGGSSKEILEAMKLVLARKRISQDLLKAHFGSSARATNILSILECDGYIRKPEGSNKWAINFDKMEAHLKAYGNKSNNMSDAPDDGGTEELIP